MVWNILDLMLENIYAPITKKTVQSKNQFLQDVSGVIRILLQGKWEKYFVYMCEKKHIRKHIMTIVWP